MSQLLLTVDIVLPIFLVTVVGWCCRRLRLVNGENVSAMNRLVFRVFLPISLCRSLMTTEKSAMVSPALLLFSWGFTFLVFLAGMIVIPRFIRENPKRGVMIQGIFRSNYAIFGLPLCEALFPGGDGGVAAMMVIGTVPIYNILGVVCLESFRGGKPDLRKVLIGIARNPLIWGCIIGWALMMLEIRVPSFVGSTVQKLGSIASPLALFVLGASIDLKAFSRNVRELAVVTASRLVIVPLIVLTIAYAAGYRGPEFAALMIAFGSPCAVSSYTMAAQMDGDEELAAQQVMLTTVLSSVTMFFMIYAFRSFGIL